jgi:hypothetical protein
MIGGARHVLANWQAGDGREEALATHVAAREVSTSSRPSTILVPPDAS